jgi:pyruvate dehydrogenase E2 component (dihydrolipoamide acetyltransferase)
MKELLQNLGEGFDSGIIVELLVKEGDTVSAGQTLFEIESEKAVVPIPASQAGTIAQILVKVGDTIKVGQIILDYSETGQSIESAPDNIPITPTSKEHPNEIPTSTVTSINNRKSSNPPIIVKQVSGPQPAASPTVKRIAHQLALDLRLVPSNSPGGRIDLIDIRNWLHSLISTANEPQSESAAPPKKTKLVTYQFEKWGAVRREQLTEIRKAISRHMVDSKNSQPHVTQFETIDITDLEDARKIHAPKWKAAGTPLTLTVLAVKACVAALRKYPIFNASIDETTDEIVFKDYYNIGIATDTDHGLMVPVISNANTLSLSEIARIVPEIAKKARTRKLSKASMSGGTFTISNQGGIGGGHFTPVINRPESAILGIGRGQRQPAIIGEEIVPRLMLPLTLSYDHRIIDGGTAVRFTLDLIEALKAFTEKELQYPNK